MNGTFKHAAHSLSVTKIILFALGCVTIFVAVAAVTQLLTFWISNQAAKTVVGEILIRTPLTIIALHLFAIKVIKTYNPSAIYDKVVLMKLLKWTAIAFVLPLSVGLFYCLFNFIVPFAHTIPLTIAGKLGIFITWLSISISAGITEEILFRGHLFMIIRNRWSVAQSIFITSVIFGLVHIVMLPSFTLLDVIIVTAGGTVAGLMFSMIYVYGRSVWYVALVHIVWDIFFIGKITAIAATQADANKIIKPFKLTTQSQWLTGGSFGVEAALPSLVLYLLVIGILYKLMENNSKSRDETGTLS